MITGRHIVIIIFGAITVIAWGIWIFLIQDLIIFLIAVIFTVITFYTLYSFSTKPPVQPSKSATKPPKRKRTTQKLKFRKRTN